MQVSIYTLAGKQDVLSGALKGRQLLAKLVGAINEPKEPEPLFLDFTQVEVATASFLREGPLAFRDLLRQRRSRFYPVITNASDAIIEDLELLLKSTRDATIACNTSRSGKPTNIRIIGELDEKQQLTFDLLEQLGEADAGVLAQQSREQDVGTTAWNNRLTALVNKGVVMELARGRRKRFRLTVTAE